MLSLLICMGLPLFAVIGYALFTPDQAPGEELGGSTNSWGTKERGGRAHARREAQKALACASR
jgi:hypothetical protein